MARGNETEGCLGCLVLLVLLLMLGGISSLFSDDETEEQASIPASEETTEKVTEPSPPAPAKNRKKNKEKKEPPPEPQTPEESIRANTRTGQPLLRNKLTDLDVFPDPGNGCTRAKIDYRTTGGMSVDFEMEEVYVAAYTDRWVGGELCNVEVHAYDTLTDRFGQQEDVLVYSTHIDGSQADRVNWNQPDLVDFESVWTVDYAHDSVQEEKAQEEFEMAVDCAVDEGFFDNWLCPS